MLHRARTDLLALTIGTLATLAIAVQPAVAHHPSGAHAADDPVRGLVTKDLVQSTDPKCRGLLMGARSGVCTHGPDPAPAPAGRDVRAPRSTAELREEAGLGPIPSVANTTPGVTTPPSDSSGAIVCLGDGTSGKRVEVVYMVASDRTDRYDQVVDALGNYVIRADRQLNASAAETGGSRHWRFVTDPDPAGTAPCVLRITKVAINSNEDDTFDASITALRNRGFNRSDRKYLMFVDAQVYCGIGTIYGDSRPTQDNYNNGYAAQYARSDAGCWNYAEAHELMHNLGGVQTNAPNATPGWHCSDEADEMCYDDDGSGPVVMRNVCAGRDGSLFDCNHDDYFYAGTPPVGNYLATNWNTANSAFVFDPGFVPDTTPPAAPAGLTPTPGPGQVTLNWTLGSEPDLAGYRVFRDGVQIASLGKVSSYVNTGLLSTQTYTYFVRAVDTAGNVSGDSATASATPLPKTTTEQVSGNLKRNALSATYTRTVQPGAVRGVATGQAKGKPAQITLTMKDADGNTIGTPRTGTSVDVQGSVTAAGAVSWTITGANGTSYTLNLTYQSA